MPLSIIWAATNRQVEKLAGNNLRHDRTIHLRDGNGREMEGTLTFEIFLGQMWTSPIPDSSQFCNHAEDDNLCHWPHQQYLDGVDVKVLGENIVGGEHEAREGRQSHPAMPRPLFKLVEQHRSLLNASQAQNEYIATSWVQFFNSNVLNVANDISNLSNKKTWYKNSR